MNDDELIEEQSFKAEDNDDEFFNADLDEPIDAIEDDGFNPGEEFE